jgi:hypothetical protein
VGALKIIILKHGKGIHTALPSPLCFQAHGLSPKLNQLSPKMRLHFPHTQSSPTKTLPFLLVGEGRERESVVISIHIRREKETAAVSRLNYTCRKLCPAGLLHTYFLYNILTCFIHFLFRPPKEWEINSGDPFFLVISYTNIAPFSPLTNPII